MAVTQGVATIRLQSLSGGSRTWVVSASGAGIAEAGDKVTLLYGEATDAGLAPPDAPNNDVVIRAYIDDSTSVVRTFTVAPDTAFIELDLWMTHNGLESGVPRAGTLRLYIEVEKTNGGPTATYHVDTDLNNGTPPTGGSVSQVDQGWVRSDTDVSLFVSNVSASDVPIEPAVYGDDLWHVATFGASGYESFTSRHTFTGTSKTRNVTSSSAAHTASFTGASTSTGQVNEGFPAADATYQADVEVTTTSGLTGNQLFEITSKAVDELRVDPRLTATWLLTLNDGSFGSPPRTDHEGTGERPSSDFGRVAVNLRDARGAFADPAVTNGVNGLSVTVTGQPSSDPSVSVDASSTTASRGGEDGWSDFVQWTNPLPGGEWTFTVDVTSPSDINDPAYIVDGEVTYTLIASRNPFVALVVDAGHSDTATEDRHLVPGDTLEAVAFLEYTKLGEERLLEFDAGVAPRVAIKRVRSGMVEYWDGSEFVVANPTLGFLPMTQVSTYVWRYQVTSAEDWSDVIVQVAGLYTGVSYAGQAVREFVGAGHAPSSLDAVATGLIGLPSFK